MLVSHLQFRPQVIYFQYVMKTPACGMGAQLVNAIRNVTIIKFTLKLINIPTQLFVEI
jgi:glutaredoxin-related protein